MDSKQHITLNVTKGDHTFTFTMPVGSTYGTALDASFDILDHLRELVHKAVENSKPFEAQPLEATLVDTPSEEA